MKAEQSVEISRMVVYNTGNLVVPRMPVVPLPCIVTTPLMVLLYQL